MISTKSSRAYSKDLNDTFSVWFHGPVAQLVRAPPCHGGGRRFKSVLGRFKIYGVLAQLGEHLPYKQRVIGSSPIGPIIFRNVYFDN